MPQIILFHAAYYTTLSSWRARKKMESYVVHTPYLFKYMPNFWGINSGLHDSVQKKLP